MNQYNEFFDFFIGQFTNWVVQYTYSKTGLYNMSVTCKSTSTNSQMGNWVIVYLPKANSADASFTQIFVPRAASSINLQLPFDKISSNLNLNCVDILNPSNSYQLTPTSTQIQLEYDRLTNSLDIQYQIS